MIRTKSIQTTLLATILFLTVILIAAVSFFAHRAATQIINDEADKLYSQKVQSFSLQTDTYLEGYRKLLEHLAENKLTRTILASHDMTDYQNRRSDPDWVALRTQVMVPFVQKNRESIHLLYAGSEKHGENYRHNDTTYKTKYDARLRVWYRTALKKDGFAFTNYPSANRKRIDVTISTPVKADDGRLLGVAGMDLITEKIFQSLSQGFLDSASFALVLDSAGAILFHPEQRILLKNISDSSLGMGGSFVEMGQTLIRNKSGKVSYTDSLGTEWITYFSPVGTTGWIVGIGVRMDVLHAPIQSLVRNILIIDFIVLALVLVFSWFITRRLTSSLGLIVENLRVIATGETSHHQKLTINTHDEFGDLAHWFNTFADRYEAMFEELRKKGSEISALSAQLNQSMSQLNAATVEQSAAVVETTSTMEEMFHASTRISESSDSTLEAANRNQDTAREGVELIRTFVKKMSEIDRLNQEKTHDILQMKKKVTRINEVMGMIRGINEQTKLISFNASLEASGAGEAGKRFTVVANEIRRLADTVQESMEEIRVMTDEVQSQTQLLIKGAEESNRMVASGVQSSRDVEQHFNSIFTEAQSVTSNSRQISQAANQQKVASEQIVKTLHDISQAINHVVGMTTEVGQISRELELISSVFSNFGAEDKARNQA